ncbi:hypothetical protein [Priestia aryabhattai]|uniref:hypothetical protein n=1 Tax=Priestia aryabhattai TaxID=412384 RepID=UPI003B66B38F
MNIIRGFHGTNKDSAEKIKQEGFDIKLINENIYKKPNKVRWLGQGAYFFENNLDCANKWAEVFNTNPSVVEGIIHFEDKDIFDVTQPYSPHAIVFEQEREVILKNAKNRKLDIKTTMAGLDGKIFDQICRKMNYKVVKASTYTPFDLCRENKVKSNISNVVEVCVRDKNYIKEIDIISSR